MIINLFHITMNPLMLRGVQAMAAATQKLLASAWAGGGERDVYADLNQLTLDIVTEVLFGWDIPRQQAQTIVGKPIAVITTHETLSIYHLHALLLDLNQMTLDIVTEVLFG